MVELNKKKCCKYSFTFFIVFLFELFFFDFIRNANETFSINLLKFKLNHLKQINDVFLSLRFLFSLNLIQNAVAKGFDKNK